jgi:hypothetical protein
MHAAGWNHVTTVDEVSTASRKLTDTLAIAMVYEDVESLEWARQVCDRVTGLVGSQCLVSTSWRICDLTQPDVVPDAIEVATRADVIIVSVHEADELPLDLYAWIEAWLPRRGRREGALVALLAARPGLEPSPSARSYLEAVARRSALVFLPERRESSPTSPAPRHSAGIVERVHITTHTLKRILSQGPEVYRGWGINE